MEKYIVTWVSYSYTATEAQSLPNNGFSFYYTFDSKEAVENFLLDNSKLKGVRIFKVEKEYKPISNGISFEEVKSV